MKKFLSQKPARKPRKPQFEMTPEMQRHMDRAAARVGALADKEARKDDKIQRQARTAIVETFDAWLEGLEDEAPEQVEDMFFELGCLATATNRRRIFKHDKAPAGVAERVQKLIDRWKVEEEAAKAAALNAAQVKPDADDHA